MERVSVVLSILSSRAWAYAVFTSNPRTEAKIAPAPVLRKLLRVLVTALLLLPLIIRRNLKVKSPDLPEPRGSRWGPASLRPRPGRGGAARKARQAGRSRRLRYKRFTCQSSILSEESFWRSL